MSDTATPTLIIRMLDEHDSRALARVAGRDSAVAPRGPALGAFENGHLIAALALGSGRVVADPFHPTAAAVGMLRTRREMLRALGPQWRSSGAIVRPAESSWAQ